MNGGNAERQGWSWFDDGVPPSDNVDRLRDMFRATFATPAGRAALAHLRQLFIERRVPPGASDAELHHVEGGRAAIAYIERLATPAEGRSSVSGDMT